MTRADCWLTLDEAADFSSGGTPSKANPAFWSGDIPWISAKDMKSLRIVDAEDRLTVAGLAAGSRLAPRGSTLVLVRGMTLLNDVPICIAGRDVAFNQDVKALIAKRGVDSTYLSYAVLAAKPQFLAQIDLAGHGTGKLPTDIFKAIRIRVPDEEEQRAIARMLSELDDKIDLNRRISQTLEAIAQALFKSWFVDLEHEWPTDDWQTKPLDSVAGFLNGLALQKYPVADGEESLPVIKIAQLRAGHTKSADRAGMSVPEAYVINDGDLLFSWSGSLEVDFWCGGRGALNQHLFKVSSTVAPLWFAYFWTKHHLPEFRSIAANKATTMGHIQRKHLTAAEVLLPPPAVLAAMDKAMRPIITHMIQLRLEARTLAELRDELLPKLLSGELTPSEGVGAA
jgi:type I restriction enzyme S subunit